MSFNFNWKNNFTFFCVTLFLFIIHDVWTKNKSKDSNPNFLQLKEV